MGGWHCPYCANDLTLDKAKIINHSVNIPLIEKIMNQQKGLETYRQLNMSQCYSNKKTEHKSIYCNGFV